MIGYITLSKNDLEKAVAFYNSLRRELGGKRMIVNGPLKPVRPKNACVFFQLLNLFEFSRVSELPLVFARKSLNSI